MSLRNLKWLTSKEARLGVGHKMLQLVTRMSTSQGRTPAGREVHRNGCWWGVVGSVVEPAELCVQQCVYGISRCVHSLCLLTCLGQQLPHCSCHDLFGLNQGSGHVVLGLQGGGWGGRRQRGGGQRVCQAP
jgi:hypothetical protein